MPQSVSPLEGGASLYQALAAFQDEYPLDHENDDSSERSYSQFREDNPSNDRVFTSRYFGMLNR